MLSLIEPSNYSDPPPPPQKCICVTAFIHNQILPSAKNNHDNSFNSSICLLSAMQHDVLDATITFFHAYRS
jgi:hypothetical protein